MDICISVKTDREGRFVDLFDSADVMRITEYSMLNREIVVDGSTVTLGEEKTRVKVSSVDKLIEHIKYFMEAIQSVLSSENMYNYLYWCDELYKRSPVPLDFSISDAERQLIVDQIVVDFFFDKYLRDSEKIMNHSKHAKHIADMFAIEAEEDVSQDMFRKSIERSMDRYYNMIRYSALREEVAQLGFEPDNYANYYNPQMSDNTAKEKHKFVWDQLYYNRNHITGRQYRRQLTKTNRNYSYKNQIDDLNEYNKFVDMLLPKDNYDSKDYFNRSMDFYALETYKRIDFILKIAEVMSNVGLTEIDKIAFLLKRFHPIVLVPSVTENNLIRFDMRVKYYRPALMLEEAFLQQLKDSGVKDDLKSIAVQLQKCQIIRAKVYETLQYHIAFVPLNYISSKSFFQQSYNLCLFHTGNAMWNKLKEYKWNNMNLSENKPMKELLNGIISLNNVLFPPSERRIIHTPKDKC